MLPAGTIQSRPRQEGGTEQVRLERGVLMGCSLQTGSRVNFCHVLGLFASSVFTASILYFYISHKLVGKRQVRMCVSVWIQFSLWLTWREHTTTLNKTPSSQTFPPVYEDYRFNKVLSLSGAERSARRVAASAGWREKRGSGNLSLLPRSFISPRGWIPVWLPTALSTWLEDSVDMRTEDTRGKGAAVTWQRTKCIREVGALSFRKRTKLYQHCAAVQPTVILNSFYILPVC